MDNLLTGKYIGTDNMFDNYFLSIRMLYLTNFNKMPNRLYVGKVDGEKVLRHLKNSLQGLLQIRTGIVGTIMIRKKLSLAGRFSY